MPAAGAKGSFTSIGNSILINLFTANIIESSWGPLDSPPHPPHTSPKQACLAHCCAGIRLETKAKTVLIPSRVMWVCSSLFISITELLLTSKALSSVSEAFSGYVNSILLCYLFLSSPLSSPALGVGFFLSSSSSFFFSQRHHKGHISLCYRSTLHFCSIRKNYEPGGCPCPV